MTQPRESTSDQLEKCGCAVAILNAGFMHDACNQKARGVSEKVPFAPLDLLAWMGSTHFQMKTLKNVSTEMALHVLAYNMKRMMRILGVGGLMEAIRA